MRIKTIRLKRWEIEVYETNVYEVIAADEMDARIMACILDGVFPQGMKDTDADEVSFVRLYTRVRKVSNA